MSAGKGKVVVAMSGGVDSSVAACLLHEQGYDVIGLFMRTGTSEPAPAAANTQGADGSIACASGAGDTQTSTACASGTGGAGNAQASTTRTSGAGDTHASAARGDGTGATAGGAPSAQTAPDERHRGCCSALDAGDARAVAGKLGIPFFALNFKEQFDRIIDYFAEEYIRGRTPNPCVMCNEHLKFGRLADYGAAAGADFVATGHYARIECVDGQYRLRRAVDERKDQSYVLFGIDRQMLARTLFPIGGMTKDEVRDHARRFGLSISEKQESMDICFVPDRDYARIVRERRPDAFADGPIVDASGKEVGRHTGIGNFTIGQRRGTGVALGLPVYVTGINVATNTVTIGGKEQLAAKTLTALRVHWLIDPPEAPIRAEVKIRYQHRAAPATVEPLGTDAVRVRFDEPQTAVTPGQAAVFYDGDIVLGGGWIEGAGGVE